MELDKPEPIQKRQLICPKSLPVLEEKFIKEVFNSIDTDGDGKISLKDVSIAGNMNKLGLLHSLDSYKQFMLKAKEKSRHESVCINSTNIVDNDIIEYSEFREWCFSREEVIYDLFEHIDMKHSGHVDARDVREYLFKTLGRKVSLAQAAALVDVIDRDHHGCIEFNDLLRAALFTTGQEEDVLKHWMASDNFISLADGASAPTALRTLTSGLIAGGISRTATAPFDRLAMVLRAGGTTHDKGGMVYILRSMVQKGGLRSLWRGNGVNCVQVGPETAFMFFFYENLKRALAEDSELPTFTEKFFLGGLAGFFAMTLVYPLYVAQARLAIVEEGTYSGLVDFFRKTYTKDGLAAFASGYVPSAIRIFPYKGIDMLGYVTLKELFVSPGQSPSFMQSLCFGAAAGAASQIVTAPLLTARTKLMAQGPSMGRPFLYKGVIDCFKKTLYGDTSLNIRAEGIRGLYRGLGAYLMKMCPACAIQFAAFESLSPLLKPYMG